MVTMVTTAPDTLPVTHGKLMLLQDTIRYYGHYGYYRILYRLLMINMLLPDTISYYGYYRILYRLLMVNMLLLDTISCYGYHGYYRILCRLLMVNMLLLDTISCYGYHGYYRAGYFTSYSR